MSILFMRLSPHPRIGMVLEPLFFMRKSLRYSFMRNSLTFCGVCLALSMLPCVAEQNDPALVLHYRFDSDPGEVAKDLSGNGNDGKISRAPWLQDSGHGALRFGEKFSSLDIGNPKSLQVSGDLSYEILMRLNRPLDAAKDAANVYILGEYPRPVRLRFGWQFYDNFFAAYGDTEGLNFVPIDPRELGAAWSRLTVVFEYPRVRVYRDGKLIREQLMLFPATQKLASPKFLGGIPEAALSSPKAPAAVSSAPVDISEFRLYKRALTEAEIAAHAADNDVSSADETRVTLEPDWYAGKLAVRFISKGRDLSDLKAEITLFSDGKKLDSQLISCSDVSGNESDRFAAVAEFPLADLKDHKIEAKAIVSGGEPVSTVAMLQKPDWIQTKAGFADIPPQPWTPVKAATVGGETRLDVWGRDYVFGSDPFPSRIESDGHDLLAAPISLKGSAGGKPIAWNRGQVALETVSPVEAAIQQTQESGPLSLKIKSSMGYDGYLIFDCEVQAREETTLDNLALEIPLHSRYSELCAASYVYEKDPLVSMSESHWGEVKGDLDFRFAPSIWLGDNERGLTWQSESDEFWRNADPQKAIQVQSRDGVTVFRANFIGEPLRLKRGQTLSYKFALLATPVKPMLRDAWDLRVMRSGPYGKEFELPERKIGEVPQLKYIADAGVRNMYWHIATENWPWPMSKRKDIQDAIRKLNEAAHAAGLKMNPYALHIRFPLGVEEFQTYGRNIAQLPLKISAWGNAAGQGIDSPRPGPYAFAATTQLVVQYCPKSPAASDASVHALDRRMKELGDDGVYLDGTSQVMPCSNTEHGCGYVGADGKVHPTYPVFANHEFIKRIYTVVKTNSPDGMVDLHYWMPNPAQAAFGDITFTGEQWFQLKKTGTQYASDALPLDRFRSMFMGRQVGTPVDLMSYRLGSTQKLAAISLLHDVPVRVNQGGMALESLVNPPAATGNSDGQRRATEDAEYFKLITSLWKIRDKFGMKDAEKLFYWNNADYVQVSPADCYATLFKHPKNGTLAIISNLSRERRDVKVSLNLGKLGLSGEKCEAFNPLTDEPIALGANGELTVPLASEDYAYVWIRPN